MAKKSKKEVHNGNVLFVDESEVYESQENQLGSQIKDTKQNGFWSGLGRGERIGAIAIGLLLTIGALGAGLGDKIISTFTSKDAKQSINQPAQSSSYLSTLNPFAVDSPPAPTPLPLSKEYIYAGSRMLAVEDANANAAPPTDLAVWRPSTGYWYVLGGPGSQQTAFAWGGSDDKAVPGDYDGDGKTDFSVFRKTTGYWYVNHSSNGNTTERHFGIGTDIPAIADYDGDGKTDMAVYRPSDGKWYINPSSSSDPNAILAYSNGGPGNTPVPADYDGDGKADLAIWHNTTAGAEFHILKSTTNYQTSLILSLPFHNLDDKPVVGDYDGDGKADAAVWRKGGAYQYQWHVRYSSTQAIQAVSSLGDPDSDKAVQNDYDGDGKTDMAIWRPSNGTWYIQQSSNGQPRNVQWGQNLDEPVPAYYRR